eukprot:CAMPEP_0114393070 /NCGR_PEP_ID=MMETSP0102-20121206/11250_1 /TAXON_ID=38822 ORGANISM="Pteridomonas danica, Strain PT" /NCGR_SAMPLE_ID=MMETSP0102 /ASSEMBLY_ACC=CAM_ASM_000212 /LENGTH=41 /DNA_ID= /DNA_START= /DNA_END= /DNA_ORIENTATION=
MSERCSGNWLELELVDEMVVVSEHELVVVLELMSARELALV